LGGHFPNEAGTQTFEKQAGRIVRTIDFSGHRLVGEMPSEGVGQFRPEIGWFVGWLRGNARRWLTGHRGDLRILDMFSGAGGLSLGVAEAAFACGWNPIFQAAMDIDPVALKIHRRNLKTKSLITRDIHDLVDYQLWSTPAGLEFADPPEPLHELEELKGQVDLIVGGPPCQGHSNFNNHTRRVDDRNRLYLTVPAVAAAVGAKAVVIENVQPVLRDKHNVVGNAASLLRSMGFHVTDLNTATLKAESFGVAQLRRRHFLVASRCGAPELDDLARVLQTAPPTSLQAFSGLPREPGTIIFDRPALLSEENQRRVDFLHDYDIYELPDAQRPDCHKDGHTYPSVYGRVYPDRPANTVTTGFMSPGRGRYVHPTERRGLTPHEAARLQGFPDDFKFEAEAGNELNNKALSKVIGDAVPPPLGFVPALAAILTL